jgi:hypothetical protein
MLGRGILKKTVFGSWFLKSLEKSPDDIPKAIPLPPVEEVVKILKTFSKDRSKDDIALISRYFEQVKFFKTYIEQGNTDVIPQCAKEMEVEIKKPDDVIIKQDDDGRTFYVLLKGKVDIYTKAKEIRELNQKEYIEFCWKHNRYIKSISGTENPD